MTQESIAHFRSGHMLSMPEICMHAWLDNCAHRFVKVDTHNCKSIAKRLVGIPVYVCLQEHSPFVPVDALELLTPMPANLAPCGAVVLTSRTRN